MNPSSPIDRRSRLLPNLSLLALFDAILLVLPQGPLLLMIVLIVGLFYLAYIVLMTRDMLASVEQLHPVDRALCRWSGPISVSIAVALVVLVIALGDDRPLEETWLGSRPGLFTIKYVMEVGFIFSLACWYVPPSLDHVRPLILWRALVTPLTIVYGAYVFFLPLGQIIAESGLDKPDVVGRLIEADEASASGLTRNDPGEPGPYVP